MYKLFLSKYFKNYFYFLMVKVEPIQLKYQYLNKSVIFVSTLVYSVELKTVYRYSFYIDFCTVSDNKSRRKCRERR